MVDEYGPCNFKFVFLYSQYLYINVNSLEEYHNKWNDCTYYVHVTFSHLLWIDYVLKTVKKMFNFLPNITSLSLCKFER